MSKNLFIIFIKIAEYKLYPYQNVFPCSKFGNKIMIIKIQIYILQDDM